MYARVNIIATRIAYARVNIIWFLTILTFFRFICLYCLLSTLRRRNIYTVDRRWTTHLSSAHDVFYDFFVDLDAALTALLYADRSVDGNTQVQARQGDVWKRRLLAVHSAQRVPSSTFRCQRHPPVNSFWLSINVVRAFWTKLFFSACGKSIESIFALILILTI